MGRFAKNFESLYRRIRQDIFAFCEAINYTPSWQQRQLLQAVQDAVYKRGERRIAVKSGQGPGKSKASGVVAWWILLRNVDTLVVVTAPTLRQCKQVWLAELRRTVDNAPADLARFINVTKSNVRMGSRNNWGVDLLTATKDVNAQGYHEENLMFIVDEAAGVPRDLITQIKGTLKNPNALLLQIGNPNTRDSDFFDCFHLNRRYWNTFTWNAEETPATRWFHPASNKQIEREFGRNSDVYRIRVLGEFPHQDPNCVMSTEDLEACGQNDMYAAALTFDASARPKKAFGMDFARYGGDESVLYRRSGLAVVEWDIQSHVEPLSVVEKAFRMQVEAGWRDQDCWYIPDAGGMGQGVMVNFHRAGKNVLEFHNGGKASRKEFADKVTEGWFGMGKIVRARLPYLPMDNRLFQQLATRQYFTNRKGQLVLETKDEYMKRGHDSPDRADAAVLAYYDAVEARITGTSLGRSRRVGAGVHRR